MEVRLIKINLLLIQRLVCESLKKLGLRAGWSLLRKSMDYGPFFPITRAICSGCPKLSSGPDCYAWVSTKR